MPEAGGVHVTGVIGGLQPLQQPAFHVHERGDCSAVDASSAGGHFNPAAQPHGRNSAGAHHAGDMDNLRVNAYAFRHEGEVSTYAADQSTRNDVAYRKEQLRRLQEEVIEMEDLKKGLGVLEQAVATEKNTGKQPGVSLGELNV